MEWSISPEYVVLLYFYLKRHSYLFLVPEKYQLISDGLPQMPEIPINKRGFFYDWDSPYINQIIDLFSNKIIKKIINVISKIFEHKL
jgi:hypothetical protein